MSRYLAAVVQLSSTSDRKRNARVADRLIRRAARAGASLVATPEAANYLGPHDQKVRTAEPLDGAACSQYSALAAELGIHLLLGSFNEQAPPELAGEPARRCFNTSVLFGPDGGRLAVYRKMHLFDVDVSDALRFAESDTTAAGSEPCTVDTDLGCFGFSICYDMRFPELYRELTARGANLLLVPSAFTLTTGKDHWYPLLRARAIECQSWVIAPAQYGEHDDQGLRESYGHSLIIDPWGQVVAAAPEGESLALAEIDLGRVLDVRRKMPVQNHRRL